jgi:LysR family transcriptional regulator, hydrogen peroxide-inducible genes activator
VNLRSLEYLVALAEHHHFRKAAEACFVSQPTLSTQIRKLESELGVELVERNPSGVLLTPAGAAIVSRARGIMREAEGIRQIARLHNDPEAASLRLGIFPTLAPYVLPHVMVPLREGFSKLQLMLVEEKSDVLLQQIHDGRLDIALLATPIDDRGLHEELLFDEEFVLAVPSGHPLAGHGPVPVSALADETILLLDEGHCLRDQALSVCHLAGASESDGFRATSLETLRHMVASGAGVTLLPRLAVSPPVPESPDLAIVELAAPRPSRQIAMYWRASSPFDAFLPRVAEVFRGLPDSLVRPLVGNRAE